MISIDSKYNVTMTRGDTFARTLVLTKDGESYTPASDDVITFTMSNDYKGSKNYNVYIQKEIDHDGMIWEIEASETSSLPYGRYKYDLQITYADGSVETFANMKNIILTQEVT